LRKQIYKSKEGMQTTYDFGGFDFHVVEASGKNGSFLKTLTHKKI